MVEHPCTRCGKNFPKLWKLHWHNERQYKCRPKVIPQITVPQVKDQEVDQDLEAGPGPSTQAYREAIKDGDVELKQSDIQPDLIKEKYFRADKNAPKGNI
ncbi:15478_t:CDS:1 [Racocetra fulgida]|uniref:15478_t:CDS:1 n=1 Tax=Racocetra fulgida TaxID=60492 RepID=A0A9N9NEK8_9GLOM|nr:15478_t:CDS:1 [Racocetra fulgida]